MNHKIKWLIGLSIALFMISACGLFDNLNPLENITTEIDDLAEQLPMEEIQGQIEDLTTSLPGEIETLATDLPDEIDNITGDLETLATDLPGDLDTIATDIPSEVDDIIGDLGGILDDESESENIPADIPVVEGQKDNLFGSEQVVSYMTPIDFATVLSFYQEQMPINGWTAKEGDVITEDAALLYYEKTGREATVTLSYSAGDSKTVVMIIIQVKE
jgi:hypothetical protein